MAAGADGCGKNENMTLYAELLQASVDPSRGYGGVLIENCHCPSLPLSFSRSSFVESFSLSTPHRGVAGGLCPYTKMGPTGAQTPHQDYMNGRDNASCPTLDFCPYNTYRISGDIVRPQRSMHVVASLRAFDITTRC